MTQTPIEDYIFEQELEVQPVLLEVRKTILAVIPDATEKIAYGMPTFWQGENVIHFAAFKNHLGIYSGDLSLLLFMDRIEGYKHTKGAIQFPYDKEVDFQLITDITRWRVETIEEKNRPNEQVYQFAAEIHEADKGGAYVIFPYDVREEFGKGRVKVHATFDGEPYDGSIVNMGKKDAKGEVAYIIGVLKAIRTKLGKQPGESVDVTIQERL